MEASAHSNEALSHSRLILWLVLAVVCAGVLYPGEVFFQSKYLLVFVSILAAFVSFFEVSNQGQGRVLLRQLALAFLPLVCFVPALLVSINHSRSQEVFVLLFSYACLLFSLRLQKLQLSFVIASLLLMSLVTLFIDGHALYQHFKGLEELKAQVSGSAAIDESLRLGMLSRIRTGRVFANFALPNTLAGFLTMMLPLTSCLLAMGFRPTPFLNACPEWPRVLQVPWVKLLLIVELALSLWVLALTQSFGGWVGLFASLVVAGGLWVRQNRSVNRRMLWIGFATLLFLGACWAAWIGKRRGFSLWDLKAAENPIVLRSLAFKTALDILRDFPITGVGLGNYGTINPRYQVLPQLVTQYAHNTFLQLLCEGGVILVGCLLLNGCILWRNNFGWVRKDTSQRPFELLQLGLAGSLTAWIIHNSLDIDFYFPSLGALGIMVLGLSLNQSLAEESEPLLERRSLAGRRCLTVVFTTVLCAGSLLALRLYLSQVFYELAIASADSKDIREANRLAHWAMSIQKDAPKTLLAGRLTIQKMSLDKREPALLLQILRDTFEAASRLDPYNAHFHYELSRIYRKLGEIERARNSQETARLLFPSEPLFKAP